MNEPKSWVKMFVSFFNVLWKKSPNDTSEMHVFGFDIDE